MTLDAFDEHQRQKLAIKEGWTDELKEDRKSSPRREDEEVREDGPDTMDSGDKDSVKEEHEDVLTGVYTEGCTAPRVLSKSETALVRAAGSAMKKFREDQKRRAELDACDQGSAQGKMDTCVPQRHPS
jgi:hypothetical protein